MGAWLPRLSLALLPLELLLLQLILAAGEPGPSPKLEVCLLWALAVLLPQLRPPWMMPVALLRPVLAVVQLPILLWLDQRAGLAITASPWANQSRAAALVWSLLVLLLLQWQLRSVLGTIAINPEERATDHQGQKLDPSISEGNTVAAGGTQSHGGATNTSGSKKSEPEGTA